MSIFKQSLYCSASTLITWRTRINGLYKGWKIFSWRTILTIQEMAEGQCLKSCNSCIQRRWLVEGYKCLLLNFENDGFYKKKVVKAYLTENASSQIENCAATIFNDGFYRFWLLGTANVATSVALN